MPRIGPTFGDELTTAGLGNLPIVWGDNGDIDTSNPSITEEQRIAIQAVLLAHNPDGPIAYCQNTAKRAIDDMAATVRAAYITGGVGQEMSYIYKAEDCRKFKAAGYPEASVANYPWVQAEKQATGYATAQQAADEILMEADQWVVLGSTIELIRRQGKLAIDAATNALLVASIRDSTLAALSALLPETPQV